MTILLDTRQPSLAVTEVMQSNGTPDAGAMLGTIRDFAGAYVPMGMVAADGGGYSVAGSAGLAAVLGSSWGGDGVTTFATPDTDARTVIGAGSRLANWVYGQSYGAAEVALTQANLPASLGGTGQPLDDMQPSLATRYVINLSGSFPSVGGTGLADLQNIGLVFKWAGGALPDPGQYAECAGQLLQINQNPALFAILGTTFGGNGQTTFGLPDLRGRVIVGTGNGHFEGESGGLDNVTLTNNQGPTEMGGGGQPFVNSEPYLYMTYLIATNGTTPSASADTTTIATAMTGEIVAFAGYYAPQGFVKCQGQLLAIASYPDLYAQIGTAYGGNGITNFAVPDLRGRVLLGAGDGIAVGETLGGETATVTLDHIPGLTLTGGSGAETLYGGNGDDTLDGAAASDIIRSWGGNDHLTGGTGNDRLLAANGRDTLDGGDGADQLFGGQGNDVISGGRNLDTLTGGGGVDTLSGGVAADRFVFAAGNLGKDVITDWSAAAGDKLSIDASGFGGGLTPGALAADRLVINGAPDHAFGQFLYNTSTGLLQWDQDGSGGAAASNIAQLMNGGLAVASLAVSAFDIIA